MHAMVDNVSYSSVSRLQMYTHTQIERKRRTRRQSFSTEYQTKQTSLTFEKLRVTLI